MKTVEEVLEFLEAEKQRLSESEGYHQDDIEYLDYLIAKIKELGE